MSPCKVQAGCLRVFMFVFSMLLSNTCSTWPYFTTNSYTPQQASITLLKDDCLEKIKYELWFLIVFTSFPEAKNVTSKVLGVQSSTKDSHGLCFCFMRKHSLLCKLHSYAQLIFTHSPMRVIVGQCYWCQPPLKSAAKQTVSPRNAVLTSSRCPAKLV